MVDHTPIGALTGVVVVLAGLLVLQFGLATVASNTIADLAALGYLIAAPWLYRRVRGLSSIALAARSGTQASTQS